jgi:hypothetical protein
MIMPTHTLPNYKLTVYPAVIKAPAVGHSYQVLVRDSGKQTLAVTMHPLEVARNSQNKCVLGNAPVSWASVSPAHFTIKTDQTQIVTVRLIPGHELGGLHYLDILATSKLNHTGTLQISGSVGSSAAYTAPTPSPSATVAAPCIALAPTPSAGSFPTVAVFGGVILACLLVLAVIIVKRLRRA